MDPRVREDDDKAAGLNSGLSSTRPLTFVAIVFAFASAQAAEPVLTQEQQQGKELFEATCIYCHAPRGWATERLRTRVSEDRAILAERTDLNAAYIRTVVRNGFMSMPAYTPTDLSEAQIKAIAAYLTRRATRPQEGF